jgi:aryl-alcohol dehydrogenase-like predicted oxidoreductase
VDDALEPGVNFWDTAEMYPVLSTEERFGDTERVPVCRNGKLPVE